MVLVLTREYISGMHMVAKQYLKKSLCVMLTNIEGGQHGGLAREEEVDACENLNDVDVLVNLNGTWTT